MKYVFVTGGVLSSVGKGTVCASIGKILQSRGFTVTAIKIDPYLNVDAGTMNPSMHGEVFVCEDGGEMDLDLGTYERFLDITMSKEANITTGQVYWTVINQERKGDFLGKCVQIIPHITDEIKRRIRQVAVKNKVDVVLIECGGTVGDIEALPFYEAFRQLRLEEGTNNTVFTHVPLVPILVATNEQKSKPTQHSIQELRRIGLQPDLVVARCETMLEKETRDKIALFGSVDRSGVFTSPDVRSIYEIPLILDKQGLGDYICKRLDLPKKRAKWTSWRSIVHSLLETDHELKIAICGKYAKLTDSYISINNALRIASAVISTKVGIELIETEMFEESPENLKMLSEFDGVLVPGGFGSRGTEGKIAAIEYARVNNIPFLGLCFGFQLAIVEFARNACSLVDANSTEIKMDTNHPVIDLLPEQKNISYMGATMRLGGSPIIIKHGTLAYQLYNADTIYERHRHRYEVSPKYISTLTSHGLVFSGTTPDKIRMEIAELPNHCFFLGTQYHPEFKSRPGKPDPAFYGFLKASLDKKLGIQPSTFDKEVSENAEAKHLRYV
ncbi:MAG: CTP synthase (glutamine hydrolyzing) [Candidatus Bathyarchaeota archaeon]|nr:MAG: CTP synthase (glutamine hydrolyzing) [Candidatus Bathyarchaeota archaeon]